MHQLSFNANDTILYFELDSSSVQSQPVLIMNAMKTQFEFLRLKLNTDKPELMTVHKKSPRGRSVFTLVEYCQAAGCKSRLPSEHGL